jgi:hypothetical protein
MDEAEKAILCVLNNPKLTSGEKAAAVKRMTGTEPHPAQAWLTSSARRATRHEAFQHAQVLRHQQIVG